jgi:hypothetical protein
MKLLIQVFIGSLGDCLRASKFTSIKKSLGTVFVNIIVNSAGAAMVFLFKRFKICQSKNAGQCLPLLFFCLSSIS